jgi:hypothetical protein
MSNPNATALNCFLGFTVGQNQPYFLFGDVFMRNFYSIHDLENAQLGLVPHRYSDARIISKDKMRVISQNSSNGTGQPQPPIPPNPPDPSDPIVSILTKIVIILIVVIICILLPLLVVTLIIKYLTFKFPHTDQ